MMLYYIRQSWIHFHRTKPNLYKAIELDYKLYLLIGAFVSALVDTNAAIGLAIYLYF